MTMSQPTPPQAAPASYWQAPSARGPEYQIIPRLRARLVALVAALVIQATIAAFDVLPHLPSNQPASAWAQPPGFWLQFALVEFLAAAVISLGFGPGIGLRDLPAIALVVLGVGFLALPAAALVLGGVEAVRAAATYGTTAAAASGLAAAFFATIFFGLPLIALAAPVRRAPQASALSGPVGESA